MAPEGAPPLAGVRVVDFGHYIAGPLAGMLLADQGAQIIKVDRPGTRSANAGDAADAMYNRGKTRLELDLKSEAGLAAARRLIAAADVVIENFRPGVMDRLGLGAHVLTERHPRLIYLSLPGFASTDLGKANIRAFEGVLNAAQRAVYRPGLGGPHGRSAAGLHTGPAGLHLRGHSRCAGSHPRPLRTRRERARRGDRGAAARRGAGRHRHTAVPGGQAAGSLRHADHAALPRSASWCRCCAPTCA